MDSIHKSYNLYTKSMYFTDTLHPISSFPLIAKLSDESTSFIQKQKLHFFLEESIIFTMRPYKFSITKHFYKMPVQLFQNKYFCQNIINTKPVHFFPVDKK